MGIVLRNTTSLFTEGIVNNITTKRATKTSVIPLPGCDSDVVQKMGKNLIEFTLKGIVTGSSAIVFLEDAVNGTGSFYFSSTSLGIVLIQKTVVHFTELQWTDAGNRPLERAFTLKFTEIT
jgi:hypothetical protein